MEKKLENCFIGTRILYGRKVVRKLKNGCEFLSCFPPKLQFPAELRHDWTPMHYAMWNSRLPIARLILSAKGDRPAADVFNHEQALFYTRSSEVVEWALDTCIKESPAGRLFDGLNLVSVGAGSLLHHCAFFGMVSPRIAQLLRHQLKER